MSRKTNLALIIVLTAAVMVVLLPAISSPVDAQHGCKAFHAVVQGVLPTPNQFLPTDVWGGTVYASLAGESLLGRLSGNDGTEYDLGPASAVLRGGVYKVCFGTSGCKDSFTYQVPQAFVIWPTANSLGSYRATANIVRGTGRFASAWGYMDIPAGPFIVWDDPHSPFGVSGRWNDEFIGSICGVR